MPYKLTSYTLGKGLNASIADARILSKNLPRMIVNSNKNPNRVPELTSKEFETILSTFLYPLATDKINSSLVSGTFERSYQVETRQRFGRSTGDVFVPTIDRWAQVYQDWRNVLPANLTGVNSNQQSNLLNSLDQLYVGKILPLVQTSVINPPKPK